jgi:hypothetical protein
MFKTTGELADRGRLRADLRRGDSRLRGRRPLVRARVFVAACEDGHGLPARFVGAEARTHEPEAVPMVLAGGVPVPGKKHSLARWKHPQDETGERVAGDFVAGGAGLGLAGLRVREHGNLQTPNQIDPKPNQRKALKRPVLRDIKYRIRAAGAKSDHVLDIAVVALLDVGRSSPSAASSTSARRPSSFDPRSTSTPRSPRPTPPRRRRTPAPSTPSPVHIARNHCPTS